MCPDCGSVVVWTDSTVHFVRGVSEDCAKRGLVGVYKPRSQIKAMPQSHSDTCKRNHLISLEENQ